MYISYHNVTYNDNNDVYRVLRIKLQFRLYIRAIMEGGKGRGGKEILAN